MGATPLTDRRRHQRHPLGRNLEFRHERSGRDFTGQCVDYSRGGLGMLIPATAPLSEGDEIGLPALGGAGGPDLAELLGQPRPAVVVRVNRRALLSVGCVHVGLKFLENS